MLEVRQDMAREQVGLGGVRVAGQDERLDAHRLVGAQLGEHLVRVADDRGAAARAGAADAGPQIVLDVALRAGGFAQLGLAADALAGRVERLGADGIAGSGVELGQQAGGGVARLGLCIADDDMDAVAELEGASVGGGAGAHVVEDGLHCGHRVGPHQIDVGGLGGGVAGIGAESAEVERRALAGDGGDAGRVDGELVVLAVDSVRSPFRRDLSASMTSVVRW